MNCKNKSFMTKKKAFTLIELLIVIAIIGILFIILVSKVDFATDKAKATGVQTDFRSFQVAFETVSRENAGFNTFGWDTGDLNANGKKDTYDEGDTNKDNIQDSGEVWTGHKVPGETFTGVFTLIKPGTDFATVGYDSDAIAKLETAINANLDPKLHITIGTDGKITMANGAQDPWNTEYHGYYITNATVDKKDQGAIVMYSNGANGEFGSEHFIANGIVSISISGNNKFGKDDYALAVVYTYINGYGEVKTATSGFSSNQNNNGNTINNNNNAGTNDNTNVKDPVVNEYGLMLGVPYVLDNSQLVANGEDHGVFVYVFLEDGTWLMFSKYIGLSYDYTLCLSDNYFLYSYDDYVLTTYEFLDDTTLRLQITIDASNEYKELHFDKINNILLEDTWDGSTYVYSVDNSLVYNPNICDAYELYEFECFTEGHACDVNISSLELTLDNNVLISNLSCFHSELSLGKYCVYNPEGWECGWFSIDYQFLYIYDDNHDYVFRLKCDHANYHCNDTCNMCGRVVEHQYDNNCDTSCNVCNFNRTVMPHVYDRLTLQCSCGAIKPIDKKASLNDYTWLEIKAISRMNLTESQLSSQYNIHLGDSKIENGYTYIVVDLYDNDYDGFVFIYNAQLNAKINPNAATADNPNLQTGGYKETQIVHTVNNLYYTYSEDLQNAIKTVSIKCNRGGWDAGYYYLDNMYVFAPSMVEIVGPLGWDWGIPGYDWSTCFDDGQQFDLFVNNYDAWRAISNGDSTLSRTADIAGENWPVLWYIFDNDEYPTAERTNWWSWQIAPCFVIG